MATLKQLFPVEIAYQVTYRICEEPTDKGTSKERYDNLVDALEKYKAAIPSENFANRAHTSTSCWMVRADLNAFELYEELKIHISEWFDILEVIQIVPDNKCFSPPASKCPPAK